MVESLCMDTTHTESFRSVLAGVDARLERAIDALPANHAALRDLRLAAGDVRRVLLGIGLGLDGAPSRDAIASIITKERSDGARATA